MRAVLPVLAIVLVLGTGAGAQDLAERYAAQADEEGLHVEIYDVEGLEGVHLAIVERVRDGSGWYDCFGVEDGRIAWRAEVDAGELDPGGGAFVDAVRGRVVPGMEHPVVEVYDRTHMGNGALRLYFLEGRTLRLVAVAERAVDAHRSDGSVIRGDRLVTSYEDVDGDGDVDLVLSGTIDEIDPDTGEVTSSSPRRRVLFREGRTFVEGR